MAVQNYRELSVWQRAIKLAVEIYKLVKKLPQEELYALSNQMRRAVVSIPSNIAEGQARNSTKEFIQLLSIAKGANAELETQLLLCVKIGYLVDMDIKQANANDRGGSKNAPCPYKNTVREEWRVRSDERSVFAAHSPLFTAH